MNRVTVSRRRARPILLLLAALLFALVLVTPALAQDDVTTDGLKPGQTVTYDQKIPINIVFVGYDRADIDTAWLKVSAARRLRPHRPLSGVLWRGRARDGPVLRLSL